MEIVFCITQGRTPNPTSSHRALHPRATRASVSTSAVPQSQSSRSIPCSALSAIRRFYEWAAQLGCPLLARGERLGCRLPLDKLITGS